MHRRTIAFALVSVVALACGSGPAEDPHSEITTGADGLRTFTHFHERGGFPVAWADVPTELSQTRWDEATGTYEDPYVAHGAAYGGCYPYFT